MNSTETYRKSDGVLVKSVIESVMGDLVYSLSTKEQAFHAVKTNTESLELVYSTFVQLPRRHPELRAGSRARRALFRVQARNNEYVRVP
jgi:hypothetical protein